MTNRFLTNTTALLPDLSNLTVTGANVIKAVVGQQEAGMFNPTITSAQTGDIIHYSGSTWVNVPNLLSINEDVLISSPSNKQVLRYNSTDALWENETENISDLGGVLITSPQNNEALLYNSVSSKFTNIALNINQLQDFFLNSVQNGQFIQNVLGTWRNTFLQDGTMIIYSSSDATKSMLFSLSQISTATTRHYDFPNMDGTLLVDSSDISATQIRNVNSNILIDQTTAPTLHQTLMASDGTHVSWFTPTLANLGDVTLSSPTIGQVLVYLNGYWGNVSIEFNDQVFNIFNFTDPTKIVMFDCSTIATGNTRHLSIPNADGTITLNTATQNLTHKTITDSTNYIAANDLVYGSGAGAITVSSSGTPAAGYVLTASSAFAASWVAPSGGSLAGLSDVTLTSPANHNFLTYNSGTSKWVNSTGIILDSVFGLQNLADVTKVVTFDLSNLTTGNIRVISYPDATVTLVGTTTSQTLTNKVLSSSTNTIVAKSLFTLGGLGANVDVSSAAAPTGIDMAMITTSTTATSWQKPSAAKLQTDVGGAYVSVNTSTPSAGQFLRATSATVSTWQSLTTSMVTDIQLTSIANNQVLKYDSATTKFKNAFVNLSELSDITFGSFPLANNTTISYSNSTQFAFLGASSTYTSPDLVTWTAFSTTQTQSNPMVTFYAANLNKYVYFDVNMNVYFSTNSGASWSNAGANLSTKATSWRNNNGNTTPCFISSKWIASGSSVSSGNIGVCYSSDLITWTSCTLSPNLDHGSGSVSPITSNSSKCCFLSITANKVYVSTDAITFTANSTTMSGSGGVYDIGVNGPSGSIWIVTYASNTFKSTDNAVTFGQLAALSSLHIIRCQYNTMLGLWLAVSSVSAGSHTYTSSDAITWTQKTDYSGISNPIKSIGVSDGTFTIQDGDTATVFKYTTDSAVTWNSVTIPTSTETTPQNIGTMVATKWQTSLPPLSNTVLTSPTNGDLLQYNGTNWVNLDGGSHNAGDLLAWDGVALSWVSFPKPTGDSILYYTSTSLSSTLLYWSPSAAVQYLVTALSTADPYTLTSSPVLILTQTIAVAGLYSMNIRLSMLSGTAMTAPNVDVTLNKNSSTYNVIFETDRNTSYYNIFFGKILQLAASDVLDIFIQYSGGTVITGAPSVFGTSFASGGGSFLELQRIGLQ